MNLRQKCKKLKQENERLKHMKVPVARYLPPYIETLGVRKMVTENELHVPPSYIEKKWLTIWLKRCCLISNLNDIQIITV